VLDKHIKDMRQSCLLFQALTIEKTFALAPVPAALL
jgi:hypothetical protein